MMTDGIIYLFPAEQAQERNHALAAELHHPSTPPLSPSVVLRTAPFAGRRTYAFAVTRLIVVHIWRFRRPSGTRLVADVIPGAGSAGLLSGVPLGREIRRFFSTASFESWFSRGR